MERSPVRVDAEALHEFVVRVFEKMNVPSEDAETAADVLVQADLRGVDSHGVARLGKYYVAGLQMGIMNPRPEIKLVKETPATALIDGGGGLGMVVGAKAMNYCIRKAKQSGAAFVSVRNSNHFGVAAYYAMMALPQDMVGISLTQANARVVPTFGRQPMLGTNPISVAVPTREERPFVLDMATSVVARGKLEVAAREKRPIPLGWALDKVGNPTTDAREAMESRANLPLGGLTETGGHKGYGLALVVDILSGILSGWGPGATIKGLKVGHFFGALRVDGFRPVDEFKEMMDDMIRAIRASPKAPGQDRIYIHGEIEFEAEEENKKKGIPLHPEVIDSLREIAGSLQIAFDL
ncbi:MAG: Ldh family oxidoreductase [Chloroflexi bacterium]|nr:Ldh family oxidoreductase [Chloroflexota bacterium]